MAATVLLSVIAFSLLMGLMALSVMLGGKRLAGSCGGNPDSAHCGCSPERRAACRAETAGDPDDEDVFSRPFVTEETLAPPGEQRLVQLRTGKR